MFLILVALYSILVGEVPRLRAFPVEVQALKGAFGDLHFGRSKRLWRTWPLGIPGFDSWTTRKPGRKRFFPLLSLGSLTKTWWRVIISPYPTTENVGSHRVHFPVESLVIQYETSMLEDVNSSLRDFILRAYVETIPRHLPEPGDNLTVVVDVLVSIVGQENSSMQQDVLAVSENITVSSDTEEYRLLEMNITEGIKSSFVSTVLIWTKPDKQNSKLHHSN